MYTNNSNIKLNVINRKYQSANVLRGRRTTKSERRRHYWNGQGGQKYCRQKDYLGSPEACWGNYELSLVSGEKRTWEVKDLRVQAGLVSAAERKGSLDLLYSPQSQALLPTRMSGDTAFLSTGQTVQGHGTDLSCLCDPVQGTGVAFLFDVPSAQLNYLCS